VFGFVAVNYDNRSATNPSDTVRAVVHAPTKSVSVPAAISVVLVYIVSLWSRTITAIPRQQTNRIQGNTATYLDIRDRAMGMQQAIQHQDPPNILVKNAQNDQ